MRLEASAEFRTVTSFWTDKAPITGTKERIWETTEPG